MQPEIARPQDCMGWRREELPMAACAWEKKATKGLQQTGHDWLMADHRQILVCGPRYIDIRGFAGAKRLRDFWSKVPFVARRPHPLATGETFRVKKAHAWEIQLGSLAALPCKLHQIRDSVS